MTDNVNKFKDSLDNSHVLYTMIIEHELILGFLDELENLNQKVQKYPSFEDAKPSIEEINIVINQIIGAEPHHQREERVLFTELERKGVMGPPKVMRWEHHELRQYKHEIRDFSKNSGPDNFETTRNNLNFAISQLVNDLREHIFKENNVLYPMAVNFIPDNDQWKEMKKACDEIGYCSFTPVSSVK